MSLVQVSITPSQHTPYSFFLVAFNLQTGFQHPRRGAEYKDYHEEFITRGYWHMGFAPPSVYVERFTQMKPGDRIALKKRVVATEGDIVGIAITAIGIVKSIDPETRYVYVDWVQVFNQHRSVQARCCHKTIHGPFNPGDDADVDYWLGQIFRL